MAKKIGIVRFRLMGGPVNKGKVTTVFAMNKIKGAVDNFIAQFMQETAGRDNEMFSVKVTKFDDSSVKCDIKGESVSTSLLKALNIQKGSGVPNRTKVGSLPLSKVREIAERKLKDLNAYDVDAAVKILSGTARSAGIDIKES